MSYSNRIDFKRIDALTMERSSGGGRGFLVFIILTEMDATFQPIRQSDAYQIKLLLYINDNLF